MMRKLTASFILGPQGNLLENHTLLVSNGTIAGLLNEVHPDAEVYEGILTPGFINTHCHLELSLFDNKIQQHTGLHGFIKEFVAARKTYTHGIEESIAAADAQMWKNGIQGVGDICNNDSTFSVKQQSPIRYHNFIELFNMNPANAEPTFMHGEELYNKATSLSLPASIVPHAPYSVPPLLMQMISKKHKEHSAPWCIHNQETKSENELFVNGKGKLAECFAEMGIDSHWFHPTGKNSLQSISNFLPEKSNLLFVHNTWTSQLDIDFLKSENGWNRSWFSICAKANLFIENRVPDLPMLIKNGCNISVGTDSLASNDTLSVLEELKVIHRRFPEIEIATLLTWATKNGAAYFGWNDLGAFDEGAKPGVIQITAATSDFIEATARVNRII